MKQRHPAIKNVVFDVGNVLVRWAPLDAIQSVFPEHEARQLFEQMRPAWIDLNLGKVTEKEAILSYQSQLKISEKQLVQLMHKLKVSQTPIPGSLELLKKLSASQIPLYSITDNVQEIIEYHRTHSNFLSYFRGMVASCDVGVLKPNEKIYKILLEKYALDPAQSVFIDDITVNVEGALAVGMHAFQFTDAKNCEEQLIALGIKI